jgi:hypothetical protein
MTPWSAPTTPAGPSRGSTPSSCKAPAPSSRACQAGRPEAPAGGRRRRQPVRRARPAVGGHARPSPPSLQGRARWPRVRLLDQLQPGRVGAGLDLSVAAHRAGAQPAHRPVPRRRLDDTAARRRAMRRPAFRWPTWPWPSWTRLKPRATPGSASRWPTEAAEGPVQAACGAGTRVFQNFQAFLANPQRGMVLSSYEFDTGSSAALNRAPYLGRGFMSILRAVPSRVAHSVSCPSSATA